MFWKGNKQNISHIDQHENKVNQFDLSFKLKYINNKYNYPAARAKFLHRSLPEQHCAGIALFHETRTSLDSEVCIVAFWSSMLIK